MGWASQLRHEARAAKTEIVAEGELKPLTSGEDNG